MPELRCTVQNCMHNQNYYCNLDAIQVGGDKAKNAADTCCDSFEERKSGTFTNAYNENCKCNAGKISVEGGGACTCKDTECATFQCR